ncbi:MAG: MBL fold metallo-hydrolase [Patescibacteria group bacterium]
MIITSHGDGYFKIQSGGLAIVIDPLDNRMKADAILKTKTPLPLQPAQPLIPTMSGPGEYEFQEIEISGFPVNANAKSKILETIYKIKAEDISLVFLGNPEKLPETEIIEKIGDVDIIFAPPESAKFIKQLEPKIIIASYFKNSGDAEKEFEHKITVQEKLTIKKKDIGDKIQLIMIKV